MKKLIIAALLLVSTSVMAETYLGASVVSDNNNNLICVDCGTRDNFVTVKVKDAEPSYFYTEHISTIPYMFIYSSEGSSCPGGGWYSIYKGTTEPKAVRVPTTCDEIKNIHATSDGPETILHVLYQNGKKAALKFKN